MTKIVSVILVLFVTGCAGNQIIAPIATQAGFYHRVEKGQTLWAISRQYGLTVEELIEANKISEASRIESGQLLFIPREKSKIRSTPSEAPANHSFVWPVQGRVISGFGTRQEGITNKGIHIAANDGTNIVAALDGTVSFAQESVRGFGHMIIIDHMNNYQTVYAHNRQNLVKEGMRVRRSDVIAKVGSTGRATLPYLHFEIRKDHKPKNPFYYLP
ncbi:MAG: peptidoglycan DD-metalloendopeptidase family protein [Candidatus Omnitrophica bacterium]|nr:peptidoglycan DD-metalloendopeptidase family protein [Candidatus Omnitrophota bacterium]